MATKKEEATAHVRIYPSTHKRLRIEAARQGITIAEVLEQFV